MESNWELGNALRRGTLSIRVGTCLVDDSEHDYCYADPWTCVRVSATGPAARALHVNHPRRPTPASLPSLPAYLPSPPLFAPMDGELGVISFWDFFERHHPQSPFRKIRIPNQPCSSNTFIV